MELSEYERLRIENIKKNEEFLRSLELASVKSTLRSHSLPVTSTKKRKVRDIDISLEPTRRSSRVANPGATDHAMLPDEFQDWVPRERKTYTPASYDDEEESERKKFTAPELRAYIEQCNPDHLELVSDKQITHGHYRISYMSAKALALRLSKIACRKGTVDKMLVFYYGLRLANLKSIARAARYRLEAAGVEFSEPYSKVEENEGDTEGEGETSVDAGSPDSAVSAGHTAAVSLSGATAGDEEDLYFKEDELGTAVERIVDELLKSPTSHSTGEGSSTGRITRSRSAR